jgi:site-specific DNA recombinase
VIIPGDKRGESHATLRGELMAILDLAAGRRRSPKTEVITNALACPRNQIQCKTPASRLEFSFWR